MTVNKWRRGMCRYARPALGGVLLACTQLACGTAGTSEEGKSLATTQQALESQWAAILDKWAKLGGVSGPGPATGDITALPMGLEGEYQQFLNGVIVSSDDFGAFYLTPEIFAKYLSLETQTDANGTNLLTVVGLPMSDTGPFGTGAAVTFSGGQVIAYSSGTYVVYGATYLKYMTFADTLGLPSGDEYYDHPSRPNERCQDF